MAPARKVRLEIMVASTRRECSVRRLIARHHFGKRDTTPVMAKAAGQAARPARPPASHWSAEAMVGFMAVFM
jgi:hypothetical protein